MAFKGIRCALALAASFIGLAGISSKPAAAQEINWRMHSIWVQARPEAQRFQEFADRVYDRSGKKLRITVHHGGALGLKDVDLLRFLPSGAVEMAAIYPGYLSRDAPDLANVYPQGAIIDPEEHEKVVPTLLDIYRTLYEKKDLKVVGFLQPPLYLEDVACKDTAVSSFEQLKGKKLRVWSKDMVESFRKLGVPAQIVPQNDLYLAMQTGVVDCAIYGLSTFKSISLQEVVKYTSYLYPLAGAPYGILANKKAWAALPADVQKVVTEEADRVFTETMKEMIDRPDPKLIAEFQASGMKILPPFSEADRRAIQKASLEVWLKLSQDISPEAVDNAKKVISALKLMN